MGAASPHVLYDCNGRIASWRTYVYFFMARDGDGPMYVKVGRSDNPIKRIGEVQTGCPFPIIKAGMVKCLSLDQTKRIERDIHCRLQNRHTSGEWFKFDWSDPMERESLQLAMTVVLVEVPEWNLEEIDIQRAAAMYTELATARQQRRRARLKELARSNQR